MMHITMRPLEKRTDWPPEKWKEDAQKALDELLRLPAGERRAPVINRHAALWSELKDDLRRLSHGKCWYCETRIDRDFGDIDHFRPKGKVEGVPGHPGYWWLAFEWRNFRFSCKLCNVKETDHEAEEGDGKGGKGALFPLLDGETYRVCCREDYEEYEDLLNENPLLLDPTEQRDVLLLTFARDGQAKPSTQDKEAPSYCRADTSIRTYHLDHSRLIRERHDLFIRIQRLVRKVQRHQARWEKYRDRSSREYSKDALEELASLISREAQYSAAARAYLKEYRKPEADWDWVDQLLTAS